MGGGGWVEVGGGGAGGGGYVVWGGGGYQLVGGSGGGIDVSFSVTTTVLYGSIWVCLYSKSVSVLSCMVN